MAKSLGAESILVQGDLQLVMGQVNGMCEAREKRMKRYLEKVKQCIKGFTTAQFQQVPREENIKADVLAKTTSSDETIDEQVKVQYVPSIDIMEVNQIDGVINSTTPIVSYLKDGVLPDDTEEVRKLRIKAVKFVLMDEMLYKRGFPQP